VKAARQKKQKAKEAQRASRAKKLAAKRAQLAKRRAARQARERELVKLRAEQRKKATARRQQSRQKKHEEEVQRKVRARAVLARRRLTAQIVEQARRTVARAKAYRASHPQLARRLKEEATTGLSKPRKPASVMASFLKQNYQRVKAELQAKAGAGSKVAGPAVVREVAAQYKALPAAEKSALEQQYKSRLAQHQQQLDKFNEAMPPKRPPTAYIAYFVRVQGDVARANPGLSIAEISKRVAEQWRALGSTEKAGVQAASERSMSAWKERLAAWHEAHPDAVLSTKISTNVGEVTKEIKAKKLAAKPKADQDKKPQAIKKAPRNKRAKGKKAQTEAVAPADQ